MTDDDLEAIRERYSGVSAHAVHALLDHIDALEAECAEMTEEYGIRWEDGSHTRSRSREQAEVWIDPDSDRAVARRKCTPWTPVGGSDR